MLIILKKYVPRGKAPPHIGNHQHAGCRRGEDERCGEHASLHLEPPGCFALPGLPGRTPTRRRPPRARAARAEGRAGKHDFSFLPDCRCFCVDGKQGESVKASIYWPSRNFWRLQYCLIINYSRPNYNNHRQMLQDAFPAIPPTS